MTFESAKSLYGLLLLAQFVSAFIMQSSLMNEISIWICFIASMMIYGAHFVMMPILHSKGVRREAKSQVDTYKFFILMLGQFFACLLAVVLNEELGGRVSISAHMVMLSMSYAILNVGFKDPCEYINFK
jgi:hypothetical protein